MPAYPPCLNPNCKSHGASHPNCMCYEHNMAEGGEVTHYCDAKQPHKVGCEYFADGGQVIDFTPDAVQSPAPSGPQSVSFIPDNQDIAKEEKYTTPGQQFIAAGEGLAKGLAGPVATGAEVLAGVKPEDIKGRAEHNKTLHYASEATGLVAPAAISAGLSAEARVGLEGLTQSGVLGKAGASVAEHLGLEGVTKVATKLGVENALYAAGDETSKAILGDPSTVQAAAIHVGLSGLIGFAGGTALGKVSESWTNNLGPKAEEFANSFVGKLREMGPKVAEEGFTPPSDIIPGPIKNFPAGPGTPLFDEASKVAEEELPKLSLGEKAAKFIADKAENLAAEGLADAVGSIGGYMSGIPGGKTMGALFGHYALKPLIKTMMPSIIKPLLESVASGEGLKAAFDTINAVTKGDTLANQAAKSVFESGTNTFFKELQPDKDKLAKLEGRLAQIEKDPGQLMSLGGSMAHYMPAHQTALAASTQNTINYIASQKPKPVQNAPLDRPFLPTPSQNAAYLKTLEIAEQPLVVMGKLKRGTLSPKDVVDFKTMYPSLHAPMVQKLNNELIGHKANGGTVPFKIRSGLSMFMGQPMDSTFSQPYMMAAQASHMAFKTPQQPQGAKTTQGGMNKLGKSVKLAQTPSEARQEALYKS